MVTPSDEAAERFRRIVFGVVVAVWVANFIAGVFPALNYQPDPMINGIFLTIAGSVYYVSSFRKPPSDPPSGGGD